MFENIDINYIVIGLIVLTLVCIYLLYNSLNSGSDSLELKKHINELVLQNKKRDEIIHFLVNQVQLLQSQPPISTIDTTKQGEHFTNLDDNNTLNGVEETVNVNDIMLEDGDNGVLGNEVLGNEVMNNNINVDDMAKLDEILAEDISLVNTECETMVDTENAVDTSNETGHETDTGNETDTDNESQGSQSSDALVDSILANDKLPPKDKNMLNLYTVSQLKDYAKELNLSMTGNKNTLVNRIYDAL